MCGRMLADLQHFFSQLVMSSRYGKYEVRYGLGKRTNVELRVVNLRRGPDKPGCQCCIGPRGAALMCDVCPR